MICKEEGCCLEQWCLYLHRLKSGFSRVDFGSLFIHRLAGPDHGTGTGLYAMVAKVGIVIQSDLEPMSVTPRRYS